MGRSTGTTLLQLYLPVHHLRRRTRSGAYGAQILPLSYMRSIYHLPKRRNSTLGLRPLTGVMVFYRIFRQDFTRRDNSQRFRSLLGRTLMKVSVILIYLLTPTLMVCRNPLYLTNKFDYSINSGRDCIGLLGHATRYIPP